MSRISKDKSDKSTITSNEIMSAHVSDYEEGGIVTFISEGVIQVDDNSSLCEGLTKSEPSTIEYLENLEKENAELREAIRVHECSHPDEPLIHDKKLWRKIKE